MVAFVPTYVTAGNADTPAVQVGSESVSIRYDKIKTEQDVVDFLAQFGWQVKETPIAEETVVVPGDVETACASYCALQREQGFGMLFIAHDLAMVRHLCHRVAVIYQGRLVEIAPTAELFLAPRHGYTKALLSAMPLPYPRQEKQRQPRYYEQPVSDGGVWHQASPQHYWLAEDGEVGE